MTFITRVNRVLVANSGSANTGTTVATITNDDVLIFNKTFGTAWTGTGNTPTSAVDNDKIYIMLGTGSTPATLLGTPLGIKGSDITGVNHTTYTAPTQEVLAIGFNGTSGALAAPINSTEYVMTIVFKDDQRPAADAKQTRRQYFHTTLATATAIETPASFVHQLNRDPFMNTKISAVMLTNGTFTALTNNATVINQGYTVTSTAHGVTAGALVRIGGTGATSPVYLVKSITDANNFVLDSPYQGVSGTVLAANIGVMSAVTSYGVKLTAIAIPYGGIDLYGNFNFTANISNSTSTLGVSETTTVLTAMSYGSGFWQSVRDMEYFAQGNEAGLQNRTLFPDANVTGSGGAYPIRAIAGSTYDIITITYNLVHRGDRQDEISSPAMVQIAFNVASATTKRDNFIATLNAYTSPLGYGVS